MGLLERIRAGTYRPDAPAVAVGGRLGTLAEAATRVVAGDDVLLVVREFLDQAGRAEPEQLAAMIATRPASTQDARADALFAAVAEYAAGKHELPAPAWAAEPERFLDRFWFVSSEPGFRAIALAQSPVSLKRRGIMWSARSLERT